MFDGLLDFKRNRADAAQFPAHGDMRPVFSTVEGEEGFFDVGEQAFRGGEAGEPLGNGAAGDDFRHGGQGVQNVPPCVRLAGSVALGEEDDPLAGNHILRAALALGVYIVPPDESVPLRADGGGAAYGVEHGGVALMQLSGDGAGGDAGEGACGWRLGIDGHPVAVPFDDVENPLAERLGDGCPGEHGEEVAAAEEKMRARPELSFLGSPFWPSATISISCVISGVNSSAFLRYRRDTISSPEYPKARASSTARIQRLFWWVTGENVKSLKQREAVIVTPYGGVEFPSRIEKGRELQHRHKNGPYTFPLRVLYNGWTPGPNTGWIIDHSQGEKHS